MTLKEQTDAKIEQGRQGNPDFMAGVDQIIAQAKAFKEGDNALDIGQQVIPFLLPNQENKEISLTTLLADGPVIIIFYRGSWCPYCNLQLNALTAHLDEIHTLGAKLIAISPQVPDYTLDKDKISAMPFDVLSDQNAKVAAEFGVAWQVPDFLLKHMKEDRKLDLETINNGNTSIMPIPATFILDKTGKITWRFIDLDYRIRSEPADVIEALKALV